MQKPDPQIQRAKESITALFVDKYRRPKKSLYYVTQLQTLLENTHFPWIVYQAASQLIGTLLSRREIQTEYHAKVVFFYNMALDNSDYKHLLETRINSICKLIDKYSHSRIGKALGEHLEGLVKAELRAQGFSIVGTHTSKYGDREWTKTGHDLDFIAQHNTRQLKIGVEVKNTLPIIEREELDTKLEMCKWLGIRPVFAARWIKPYTEMIRINEGFSWVFKTQIYPPGFEEFTKTLYRRLRLPVNVRTELPEKSVASFSRWVQAHT